MKCSPTTPRPRGTTSRTLTSSLRLYMGHRQEQQYYQHNDLRRTTTVHRRSKSRLLTWNSNNNMRMPTTRRLATLMGKMGDTRAATGLDNRCRALDRYAPAFSKRIENSRMHMSTNITWHTTRAVRGQPARSWTFSDGEPSLGLGMIGKLESISRGKWFSPLVSIVAVFFVTVEFSRREYTFFFTLFHLAF